MDTVLITGGAGFFGGILKDELLRKGFRCVSIDLQRDDVRHPCLTSVQGDIRNTETLRQLFSTHAFSAVFHCAAILAHSVKDEDTLWTSNVDGTRNIAAMAERFHVPRVIFTSSNCLWGHAFGRPVTEDDTPDPVEIYGRSKLEGENILLQAAAKGGCRTVIFRCPTIIDAGRLGLLSILFEFIDEGRRVWAVGGGRNTYQFIYAPDLADACLRALTYDRTDIFNIGSDNVPSIRTAYETVIERAHTGARVASFPRWLALPLMRLAYALGLSPLGPYQYKMIAEDFVFDTQKIQRELGWRPTLDNSEMLWKAYEYFHAHRNELGARTGVSAHKQPAPMGVIRILKWLS